MKAGERERERGDTESCKWKRSFSLASIHLPSMAKCLQAKWTYESKNKIEREIEWGKVLQKRRNTSWEMKSEKTCERKKKILKKQQNYLFFVSFSSFFQLESKLHYKRRSRRYKHPGETNKISRLFSFAVAFPNRKRRNDGGKQQQKTEKDHEETLGELPLFSDNVFLFFPYEISQQKQTQKKSLRNACFCTSFSFIVQH